MAPLELPCGSTVASEEGEPGRAARRVSEAPQADGMSVEKEALMVSGEYAAREAFVLGMAIGGLAASKAALLGETPANGEGAESGESGEVSGAPAEATWGLPLDAVPVPNWEPSGWGSRAIS